LNYNQEFTTNVNPEIIFKAITQHLNDWWGNTDNTVFKVGDEFTTSFGNAFWKFQIIEFELNNKVTWKCIDGKPEFNAEWIGTSIYWNISSSDEFTKITFIHDGLTPEFECYDICAPTWDMFITKSLKNFIETGIGKAHKN